MRYVNTTILAVLATLVIAGCGSSDSGSDADLTPNQDANLVDRIFAADEDDETVDIPDADQLGSDIDNIFGDADTDSVETDIDDTVSEVLSRAKNG